MKYENDEVCLSHVFFLDSEPSCVVAVLELWVRSCCPGEASEESVATEDEPRAQAQITPDLFRLKMSTGHC